MMIEKGFPPLHQFFLDTPGSPKTTLALLLAHSFAYFVAFSAVTSGGEDIRNVLKQACYQYKFYNKRTILFVDEIHRFNKAQKDAFLPHWNPEGLF